MKILLIKAGQTEADKLNCFCMDSALSWEGRVDLKQLVERGREILDRTDVVISSTQKSAIETAKIMFPYKYTGLESNRLDELNFGMLENEKRSLDVLDEISEEPLLLRKKYNGDNIWDRADTFLGFLENLL